jgi:hypothetical protein
VHPARLGELQKCAVTFILSSPGSHQDMAPRRVIVAVAATILITIYWLLRRGVLYADLGAATPSVLPDNSPNSASKSLYRMVA